MREHGNTFCGHAPDLNDIEAMMAEIERLRAALIQVRGFAKVMDERNWRDLRLHIERQCDALEQCVATDG